MPELQEVAYENLSAILALRVKDTQQGLVASAERTVAQTAYAPFTWTRAIFESRKAVGLIALVDMRPDHPEVEPEDPPDAVYLWRLMVDAAAQGKGYGRFAMQAAFAQARTWGRGTFCTSVVPRDDSALVFYERFGLRPTGRIIDGELFLQGPVPAD